MGLRVNERLERDERFEMDEGLFEIPPPRDNEFRVVPRGNDYASFFGW